MKASPLLFAFVSLLWLGMPGVLVAQAPPATDILLVPLPSDQAAAEDPQPINLTDRDGYDNQPSFTPDGHHVLFTSFRDGQTDIYRIALETRTIERVTETAESEYSPTVTPDAAHLSVIRVEADGTQRLWQFNADGEAPSLVLDAVKPVGYHAWADEHTLALFVLGSPPTLQLADTRTGLADTLVFGIGRSLHRVPGTHSISFVHKESESSWTIKQLDPATRTITTIVETLPGHEDYAWRSNGALLMGNGSALYEWTPERGSWEMLYDLAAFGVTNITRIAVSPANDVAMLVVDRDSAR